MIPKYYEFFNKTKILSGYRALENINYELKIRRVSHPFIITDMDPFSREIRILKNILKQSEYVTENITHCTGQTMASCQEQIVREFLSGNFDAVIALGKSLAFKVSKAVCCVLEEQIANSIQLYSESYKSINPITCIAIPIMYSFVGIIGESDIVILDPRLALNLSPRDTASLSVDILCHAIEAYTCMQKNPLSDAYSFSAVSLIRENLHIALKNIRDRSARLALSNAGVMSGIASLNSQGGIAHAIAEVLEKEFKLSHSDAIGIILPHCMDHNMTVMDENFGELLLPLAGPEIYSDTQKHERGRKTVQVITAMLRDFHQKYAVPLCLSEKGIKRSDFSDIISQCLQGSSVLYNPGEVKEEDISNILNLAF